MLSAVICASVASAAAGHGTLYNGRRSLRAEEATITQAKYGGGDAATLGELAGKDLSHNEDAYDRVKNADAYADCDYEWAQWGSCTESCGGGITRRDPIIQHSAKDGGKPCPEAEQEACNTQDCEPVDCAMSEYSEWGECSTTCGSGYQTRSRTIDIAPEWGAPACPSLVDEKECNEADCSTDCAYTWGEWSACSASCGGGNHRRDPNISRKAKNNGDPCPEPEEEECNADDCPPVACVTSDWSDWSDCSETCGEGYQKRSRTIESAPEWGAPACPHLADEKDCKLIECPQHCDGDWGDWSVCTQTCNGGSKDRKYVVTQEAKYGGNACPPDEQEVCNTQFCPEDCQMSEWYTGVCSTTCGPGYAMMERHMTDEGRYGGDTSCKDSETKNVPCNLQPCPVPCIWNWSPWSACDSTCGPGLQMRDIVIRQWPQAGGLRCPERAQGVRYRSQTCDMGDCPLDCVMASWTEWTTCTATCGTGSQTRTRKARREASYGGHPCPGKHQEIDCNSQPCPIPCSLSQFNGWSACPASCVPYGSDKTTFHQKRHRAVIEIASFGGETCDAVEAKLDGPQAMTHLHWSRNQAELIETKNCELPCCSEDCQMGGWDEWSECLPEGEDAVGNEYENQCEFTGQYEDANDGDTETDAPSPAPEPDTPPADEDEVDTRSVQGGRRLDGDGDSEDSGGGNDVEVGDGDGDGDGDATASATAGDGSDDGDTSKEQAYDLGQEPVATDYKQYNDVQNGEEKAYVSDTPGASKPVDDDQPFLDDRASGDGDGSDGDSYYTPAPTPYPVDTSDGYEAEDKEYQIEEAPEYDQAPKQCTGFQYRMRKVLHQPRCGGSSCGYTCARKKCYMPCPEPIVADTAYPTMAPTHKKKRKVIHIHRKHIQHVPYTVKKHYYHHYVAVPVVSHAHVKAQAYYHPAPPQQRVQAASAYVAPARVQQVHAVGYAPPALTHVANNDAGYKSGARGTYQAAAAATRTYGAAVQNVPAYPTPGPAIRTAATGYAEPAAASAAAYLRAEHETSTGVHHSKLTPAMAAVAGTVIVAAVALLALNKKKVAASTDMPAQTELQLPASAL